MSEPTEADRQKATTLYESMRGHTKMANIESVCDAIAQARAEGRAAGRREMREEAALHLEQHANSWAGGGPQSERQRSDAKLIRALPDHTETK